MSNLFRIFTFELLHKNEVLVITGITLLYTFIPVLLLNYQFAIFMLTQHISIMQKAYAVYVILQGLFTAYSVTDIIFMLLTGLLVGINIVFLVKTARRIKRSSKKLKLAVGGTGFIGLFSSGCASCGLSLASVLGVSTGIGSLPFGDTMVYAVTIVIMFYSMYVMLKKFDESKACVIEPKGKPEKHS